MRRRTSLAVGIASALALAALATSAAAFPSYEITPLGLTDAEHTRDDGDRTSRPELLPTDSGYAVGMSMRYSGATPLGWSAWLHDANTATTTRIGLYTADSTRSNVLMQLTESGRVAGQYINANVGYFDDTRSSWIFDVSNGSTTRVGLFDAAHTSSDGIQISETHFLTESGYAAGHSIRYGGGFSSFSGWIHGPGDASSTRVGYLDAIHTASSGNQSTMVSGLNESGFAIGSSARYAGTTSLGKSAWLYDSNTGATTRLGFVDAAHTKSNGHQLSEPTAITDSGYVLGYSERYNGSVSKGTDAWLYDLTTHATTRIGLFDAEHTRSDGYQLSNVDPYTGKLYEWGTATGVSNRYAGSAYRGSSAWFYEVGTGAVTRVGFTDAEHTAADGWQNSRVRFVTESGYLVGTSDHYGGLASEAFIYPESSAWIHDSNAGTTTRIGLLDAFQNRGDFPTHATESGYVVGTACVDPTIIDIEQCQYNSKWLYSPGSGTTRLGLFDAAHTGQYGRRITFASVGPTESGYIAGTSRRFDGPIEMGTTAWIYRASDGSQASIVLSERSDGYAAATVDSIREDGLAFGHYTLFDENDTDLGQRAFAWTAESGAVDLGPLVEGGLAAQGWAHLADTSGSNESGALLGTGRLESGGDFAYLLTPIPIPEPGKSQLMLAGLLALIALQKRKAWRSR